MLDDAVLALEEIEPEDKTRKEVLYALVDIYAAYVAAKKWNMATTLARHLVKATSENPSVWITLSYSVRRAENIDQSERILLKARALHPKSALIAFNLACCASVTGRMEEAKVRLRRALDLDKKKFYDWRSTPKTFGPYGIG
jgi:Flp pilus assembly protein TadD